MTLHYEFPYIENIRDVLPHLDDNFRVVEKDGLTFINYKQMGNDVFPPLREQTPCQDFDLQARIDSENYGPAVRRECRGLVFDTHTGDLVSRPLHKFFNAGEREDVALHLIDVDLPHDVLEKLDGSMIRPLPGVGGFRWGTKMGITDVGMLAEEFVAANAQDGPDYHGIAAACVAAGKTPIFEFCSRGNRVVIDYPVSTMVLLAVRDNYSGNYMPRIALRALAESYDCPVVDNVDVRGMVAKRYGPSRFTNIERGVADVRADEEGEGKIIVFANGHAVKIKGDKYVRVHRAKDMMRSEMRLLDLFFNEELDDLLATIDLDDQNRIWAYMESFKNEMNHFAERINTFYGYVRAEFETKKDFALSEKSTTFGPVMKSLMFGLWDGKIADAYDAADKTIRNSLTSETKFAATKEAIGIETGWDAVWANDVEE